MSSTIIKPWVGRLRPCYDPEFYGYFLLRIGHCSGGFSFPSSHATNHFGMAMFAFSTLRPFIGGYAKWFFGWAALVAFSQMYVGVHYPLDVAFGTMLGIFCGGVVYWVFYRFIWHKVANSTTSALPAASPTKL